MGGLKHGNDGSGEMENMPVRKAVPGEAGIRSLPLVPGARAVGAESEAEEGGEAFEETGVLMVLAALAILLSMAVVGVPVIAYYLFSL